MSSRTYMRVVERLEPLPTYKLVPFSGDAQESKARNFFSKFRFPKQTENYVVNLCFEKDFRFCYEIRTSEPRALSLAEIRTPLAPQNSVASWFQSGNFFVVHASPHIKLGRQPGLRALWLRVSHNRRLLEVGYHNSSRGSELQRP